MGSFQTKDRNHVPCTGRQILTHYATKKVLDFESPLLMRFPYRAKCCRQVHINLNGSVVWSWHLIFLVMWIFVSNLPPTYAWISRNKCSSKLYTWSFQEQKQELPIVCHTIIFTELTNLNSLLFVNIVSSYTSPICVLCFLKVLAMISGCVQSREVFSVLISVYDISELT